VVLEDPYVCPRHAELIIRDSGELVARDAGSVNGIRPTARGSRVPELPLKSGTKFRVGQTDLRVIDPDAPLPPSLVETRPTLAMRLTTWQLSAAVVAACIAVFVLQAWLVNTSDESVASSLGAAMAVMLTLLAWGGMWALATRIISHRFRLFAHLAWASSLAAILTLGSLAGGWLSFAFPSFSGEALLGLLALVLVPIGLAGHLSLASSMTRAARWKASLLFSVGILLIPIVFAYSAESGSEGTYTLNYPSAIRPLPPSLVHTVSLEEYMKLTAALESQVDSLWQEGLDEDAPAGSSAGSDSAASAAESAPAAEPTHSARAPRLY
jgi:hypothetical protein